MKISINVFLIFFFSLNGLVFSQMNNYSYKRALSKINSDWHSIQIPDDVYGKIENDFSDLRIYGITKKNDTIEAPFIIRRTEEVNFYKSINFKLINRSSNDAGYFYTFEVPEGTMTNRLKIDLGSENFDLKVRLEGSQDQLSWYTIVNNYRIAGLSNHDTKFTYSDISFSDSKYRYFRLFIPGTNDPKVNTASVTLQQTTESRFRNYKHQYIFTREEANQTIIELDLGKKLPVSHVHFKIKENIDFFRPIRIEYASDSVETEKGWIVNYSTLIEGDLNSLFEHDFHFNSTILNRLRIVIDNDVNQALTPIEFEISGFDYFLIARFTEDARYFLTYGNKAASFPNYDIVRFEENIPNNSSFIPVGEEETIRITGDIQEPLFKNKTWLWLILGIIILVIGFSMVRMLKKNQ
jgi:hypothetical protein